MGHLRIQVTVDLYTHWIYQAERQHRLEVDRLQNPCSLRVICSLVIGFSLQACTQAKIDPVVSSPIGPSLFTTAKSHLEQKKVGRQVLKDFMQWMVDHGYRIHSGKPIIHTSLDVPTHAKITIPIQVQLTPQGDDQVRELVHYLGGKPEPLPRTLFDNSSDTRMEAFSVNVSTDPELQQYFRILAKQQVLFIQGIRQDQSTVFGAAIPMKPQAVYCHHSRELRCLGYYLWGAHGSGEHTVISPLVPNKYGGDPSVVLLRSPIIIPVDVTLPLDQIADLDHIQAKVVFAETELFKGRLGIAAQQGSISQGVMVDVVEKFSPADSAGIRAGDRIVAVDNQPMHKVGAFVHYIKNKPKAHTLSLAVERKNRPGRSRFNVHVVLNPGAR